MQQHHFNGERQAHAVDPFMPEPHADSIMNSDDACQGFMNSYSSNMNHSTSSHNSLGYYNSHHSPEFSVRNPFHSSAQVHVHPGRSGVLHATLPDKTALFVASHLHQLRVIYGMELTIDQAIWICEGLPDIPVTDPNPVHGQIGRAECFMNISAPSTSYADSQSSTSEICELTLSGRVPFHSSAVIMTAKPKHEMFKEGRRTKVRCLEIRCGGRVLMKENYARHVRERHHGEKRKTGGRYRRGIHPRLR